VDVDMLRRAKQLGIDIDSSPSASSSSVRSIRAAMLPERGIPPLYWREMLHNGIWARILQYVSIKCTLPFHLANHRRRHAIPTPVPSLASANTLNISPSRISTTPLPFLHCIHIMSRTHT
jgi:hypothetical protein